MGLILLFWYYKAKETSGNLYFLQIFQEEYFGTMLPYCSWTDTDLFFYYLYTQCMALAWDINLHVKNIISKMLLSVLLFDCIGWDINNFGLSLQGVSSASECRQSRNYI